MQSPIHVSPEHAFARKPLVLLLSSALLGWGTTAQADSAQEVVITAAGHAQQIADAPATITVITAKEIAQKSYTTLADVLKFVPGVSVQGSGTEQSISLRGMGNTYTLFLIDGRPAQGGDTFEFNGGGKGQQMAFMPPMEMIERIEVIRGPASGLYGSDAMGGVINIITKKVSDRWMGSVTGELIAPDSKNTVNNGALNTSFMVTGPLLSDTLGLQVSGGYRKTRESDVVGFGDTTVGDADYWNANAGAKLTWKADPRNTLTFGASQTKTSNTRNPGKSLAETATATDTDSLKTNANLTHEGRYNELFTTSYLNYDAARNPTTRTNAPSGTARGINFATLTANSQGTYTLNDKHTLTGGLTLKQEELKDGATSALNVYNEANDAYVEMQRFQASLFAEEEWRITRKLALTASGRYDHNQQYGGHFSPKAYLVYKADRGLVLKGGVLTGYKAPTLRQSATDFSATSMGGVTIGNPNLKPETSTGFEIGADWESRALGLRSSLTFYRTDFKDKIARDSDYLCLPNVECTYNGVTYPAHVYGYKETINIDEARIKGLEFTFDYTVSRNVSLRGNYTLTDSEQLTGSSKGLPLNDQPKHTGNLGITYAFSADTNVWSQAAYVGKFISTGLTSSTATSQTYTLLDLGVAHKVSQALTVKLGVYNLTNRQVANASNGYIDGRRYSLAATYGF